MNTIRYNCPWCGKLFTPRRPNQYFCTTRDGWMFRNRIRASRSNIYKIEQKAAMKNLKVLSRLCMGVWMNVPIAEFMESGFIEKHAKNIRRPSHYPEGRDYVKYYEVFGFVVGKLKRLVTICPPMLDSPSIKEDNRSD